MSTRNFLNLSILTALALLLCACPQQADSERPSRGRWAGQEDASGGDTAAQADGQATDEAGDSAAADDSAAGGSAQQPCDEGAATDEDSATEGSEADSTDENGDAADDSADQQQDEAGDDPPAEPEKPASGGSSVDLSGQWLQLFSRNPQGVKPELWKSGKLYTISGDNIELRIAPAGGASSDIGNSASTLRNVRLQQDGPFLVVDQGSQGRTAFLRAGNSTSLADTGRVSGRIGSEQLAGSFRKGSSGLIVEFDGGQRFQGDLAGDAWCGFYEGGQQRGYCVLTMTGDGAIEGILFVDPYMSFNTNLRLEVVE